MIILHHLDNSRSHRVLWLLEELGLPYEIVQHRRNKVTLRAPAELRAIHPLGKAPVIVDKGRTIAESGVITQYLVETYGGGRLAPPAGSAEYWDYLYWLHNAEGSAMPPLLIKLIALRIPMGAPFFLRPVAGMIAGALQKQFTDPEITLHQDLWEATLKQHEWFAGAQFTAADIQMSYPVEIAMARGDHAPARPAIAHFIKQIQARPAYQRAVEIGGGLAAFR